MAQSQPETREDLERYVRSTIASHVEKPSQTPLQEYFQQRDESCEEIRNIISLQARDKYNVICDDINEQLREVDQLLPDKNNGKATSAQAPKEEILAYYGYLKVLEAQLHRVVGILTEFCEGQTQQEHVQGLQERLKKMEYNIADIQESSAVSSKGPNPAGKVAKTYKKNYSGLSSP